MFSAKINARNGTGDVMLSLSILLALAAASKPVPRKEAAEQEESTKPVGSSGAWVTSDDYPAAALRDEREGTTGFRLTVGPDGLPTRCEIVASSGHADLDAKTCEVVMARARFTAGRDARGRPVGVRLDKQGALLVADDVGNTVWRVTPAMTSAAN